MMLSSHESPEALKHELRHADAERRCAAIRKIAQAGHDQSGVTAEVILLIVDEHESIREWACEALESRIVPQVSEVSELVELMRDKSDGQIEYWAATMLGRLGRMASSGTGVLANCLLDSRFLAARERAAWALGQIGPGAKSAMNALRQITSDDPPRLQRLAASAIQSVVGRAA